MYGIPIGLALGLVHYASSGEKANILSSLILGGAGGALLGGVGGYGYRKGWFGKKPEDTNTTIDITGTANANG